MLIVAVSVNDALLPMVSVVGDGVVAMVGWTLSTTSGSLVQALVAGPLRPPPEYAAFHQKLPGLPKVSIGDGGIVPFAAIVTVAVLTPPVKVGDVAAVVQVLLVHREYVTVPMGVPSAPEIVAVS